MPRWLKRFLRSLLTSSLDAAFSVGRDAGHSAIDGTDRLTRPEREVAKEAFDLALERVRAEIMEEI